MRSAVEWAQVRAMAADGFRSARIAARLGINQRTLKRLMEAGEPPRNERSSLGSMLDPLEPVLRRLVGEVAGDQGAARLRAIARRLRL